MVRKGFDLSYHHGSKHRETAGLDRQEEPASFVSFIVPVCAALLVVADVISGSFVTADFFSRHEMAWFGVSLATLVTIAVM
jgi:hypothetical protein